LAILATFTPERPVLGILEIAQELGMHKGTTHRYVSTLVALGYVEQGRGRKYRLTLGVTRLGLSALSATPLEAHAHPYMQDLATGCGYTVSLAVLDGPEILYLDRVHSTRRRQNPGELDLRPGSRLPVHCTALGKVLLAHLPEPEQERLLRTLKLSRETPNTITAKQALREEIQHIALEGIAANDQELTTAQHAIAVPIRSAEREVIAALAMTANTSAISLENLAEHLRPHLVATASRISARLGYRRLDQR
jgi:IclR family pca regulon transcriptional regulator